MTDTDMETAEARFIAAQREYEDAFEALERLRIAVGAEPLSAELKRMAVEELAAAVRDLEDLAAVGVDEDLPAVGVGGEDLAASGGGGDEQAEGDGGTGDGDGDATLHGEAPSAIVEDDDEHMVAEVVKVVVVKTILSSALAKCPTHVLVPSHYRADGTCLHELREREPVVFHAGFLDQDVREAYNGQKAVILQRVESDRMDGPDFLIEFESGNRLTVFANEVTPQ